MAYVPVPKDLTRVKTKFLFNLTKRQVICFGLGALAGVPLFFLTKNVLGTSMATLLMIAVMLPFFRFAMFERHGQPLEKLLRQYIWWSWRCPKPMTHDTPAGITGTCPSCPKPGSTPFPTAPASSLRCCVP